MTVITGYAGIDKTTLVEPVTCQPHDRSRIVVDTLPVSHYQVAQNQVVQAGSKPNVIVVSSHSAKRGDYIVFEAIATIATQAAFVLSTTSTTITVAQPFTAAPIAGDTYTIFRPSKILTDSSGALTITGTANVTIVSPLAAASPAISASGVVTRVVGSVDAIYGEFSTAYTYLPVGGFDSAAEVLAPLPLTSSGTKVAVAATSLPLPTGAATSALQTTGNSSLGVIESGMTVDSRGSSNGMVMLGYDTSIFAYASPQIDATTGAMLIYGSIVATDGGSSLTVDGTVSAVCAGDIAHDAADSGNPVKIGGKALTADPTAVATGDRVNALFDKLGKQIILENALLEKTFSATSSSSITNTTSTSLVAATASVIRVITAITVSNMHASVGTIVNILDGSTVKWHGPAAALGGGYSVSGLKLVGTVNTAINVQCVTTGASVRASVNYFEIAG